MKNGIYYLGLDIGTDSVGYAATDETYTPLKFKGEPVMGVTTFDPGQLKQERRAFRTNRRRSERRRQRINLLNELFCNEITKTDERFFTRLKESNLYRKDTSCALDKNLFFCDKDYTDKEYHKQYPTIHHLISDLIKNDTAHDVRLVYIACAWLISHRGHFLSNINSDNLADVLDITEIYQEFFEHYQQKTLCSPWKCDNLSEFASILKQNVGVSVKEKAFYTLLFNSKKPKDVFDVENESEQYSIAAIIKLLSGGKADAKKLFLSHSDEYEDLESFSLSDEQEKLDAIILALEENGELIRMLKALYDYGILADILGDNPYISCAKITTYEKHKNDLRELKNLLIKYDYSLYRDVFKADSKKANYASYVKDLPLDSDAKKCTRDEFYTFIKKVLAKLNVNDPSDNQIISNILERISNCTYMPKQVNSDNRVIPHQLYYYELKTILKNAKGYLGFLSDTDCDGISTADKILSIFTFKIPYYVGPLNKNSEHSWIERKAGKIYPWNFEKMVDLDKSEEAFIRRMTNKCTYLAGEDVLPKSSLLYSAFEVLNEINTIKINGAPINVETKQKIYTALFSEQPGRRITKKRIYQYLLSENLIEKDDVISGIDDTIKSSLKPYGCFKNLLSKNLLTTADVESIIERITYSTDRDRVKKWLKSKFPSLPENDIIYLSRLKFSDFGKLSRCLLCEIVGTDSTESSTGEAFSIIDALWNTNNNLMMLLSDRFTFMQAVERHNSDYYSDRKLDLDLRLDEMHISNSVKRQIYRTFSIVKDVVKSQGGEPPKKIFVEMTRGATDEQKKLGRTKTRRQQIEELYKNATLDCKELSEQLSRYTDNELQRDQLYLYFVQFGKCMYSGEPIMLEQLGTKLYDIEHIYPRHFVKDDSIHNNKVLVLSKINGDKSDTYPIQSDIRRKMYGMWTMLRNCHAITEEKYHRLTRATPFTEDEKLNFINRQLVETSQATKAVASLLKEKYPSTDIVYVKAGLVSDFRHEFDIVKARSVNDLHHAKDAYLNVVVGNVYHERFNKQFFRVDRDVYTLNTKQLFSHPVKRGDKTFWVGSEDIGRIKRIVSKDHIHLTRFSPEKRGGFYDQLPVKHSNSPYLIRLKSNLPTEQYGGYNKSSTAYFTLIKYTVSDKHDVMIMPVEVLHADRFSSDAEFAVKYAKSIIKRILGKDADEVTFPLGARKIKPNTVFSIDGFRMILTQKSTAQLVFAPIMPLVLPNEQYQYAKKIESFLAKSKKQPSIKLDEMHDGISKEKNVILYDLLYNKLTDSIYKKRPASPAPLMASGRDRFITLNPEDQVRLLSQLLLAFCRYSGRLNLESLGGSKSTCAILLHMNLSNWTKAAKDVRIIDSSSSGLYERRSINLLELL